MGKAKIYWMFDAADVMACVALFTNGPEPPEAEAEAWLIKHCDRINALLEYTFKNYLRQHWSEESALPRPR